MKTNKKYYIEIEVTGESSDGDHCFIKFESVPGRLDQVGYISKDMLIDPRTYEKPLK
jgi:hypothetical protein